MRLSVAAGSGSVLPEGDDDVVAEGLKLAAGVAGLAAAVGVPGVPVRSEVAVAGGGVVEQVPDDDQDGPADGAAGLLPPAAAGTGGQLVASIDTICTPSATSSAASSVIAGTVAGTVCRCEVRCFLPAAGGMLTHTTADSFATSIPATIS